MKIEAIRVLRGPNRWSVNHHHLIQLKLNLGLYEHLTTDQIENFETGLASTLPEMLMRRSDALPSNDFLETLRQGTSLAQVVAPIALHLQKITGMSCQFCRYIPQQQQARI